MATSADHVRGQRYRHYLEKIESSPIDALLITNPSNLYYLFGIRPTVGLALTHEGESALFVDSRYFESAVHESRNCEVRLAVGSLEDDLFRYIQSSGISDSCLVGVESDHVTFAFWRRLESRGHVRWEETTAFVEDLRVIKEASEISIIREGFERAQKALEDSFNDIVHGRSEFEIAGRLEEAMRAQSSQGCSFDTTIATGPRSSLPHARPSARRWSEGEVLLIDYGMRFQQYCTDLTRVFLPEVAETHRIASIVRDAQSRALELVAPGRPVREVDAAARDWIARKGYGECFGHGTGHGLGLEVHEAPSISARSEGALREGMVLTIEPGIYLPGRFGIRIEDVVMVTVDGFDFLSDPSR